MKMSQVQISKMIFERQLTIMKEILRMGEFKFGKKSEEYKFFKEKVMDAVYVGTRVLFKDLEKEGVVETCSCKGTLRDGYQDCRFCSGCGYKIKEEESV